MPVAAFLPANFPGDSHIHLGATFEDFRTDHISIDANGTPIFADAYVNAETLMRILDQPNCVGIVFYSAAIDIDDPANPGQKMRVGTLAAAGVDASGNIQNGSDGPFYISKPCPPYCPQWG